MQTKSITTQNTVKWDKVDVLAVVDENNQVGYFVFDEKRGQRKGIDICQWVLDWAQTWADFWEHRNQVWEHFFETESLLEEKVRGDYLKNI